MRNKINYKDKKILVLGFAKSGYHAALLLNNLGANVTVNDIQSLKNNPDALELKNLNVTMISGEHPEDLLDSSFDLLVKNPGIPYDNPVIQQAKLLNIPIITEVEIATQIMKSDLIGVTGTNGKTTTTAIIQKMLDYQREDGTAYAIGNIGIPASQVALELTSRDDVVLELSSFQLLGTPTIQPKIAVITNIYSAHLDYHGTQELYEEAKMNLIKNMSKDEIVIYNKDQKHLEEMIKKHTNATLLPFSRKKYLPDGISIKENNIYFKNEKIISVSDIFLAGLHNLENMLAAIGVAKLKNVSNDIIKEIAAHFRGVEHRTQFVTEYNKRIFYNDSKATNIEATENALKGFNEPIILLAGGLDRGDSFESLIPLLKEHVKALITFGETAEKMKVVAKQANIKEIKNVENVEEAVSVAYSLSKPADVILLSPAAASWDQYPSFEVRGEKYMAAIKKIINQNE